MAEIVLGGTGKHLGFMLLAWAVFLLLAAWVLPPLDSHVQPAPVVYWSVLTLTIILALATVIVIRLTYIGHG